MKQLLNPETTRTRLLTLTGAGGSGKTRLAIQVATDLIDRFADGVWWVELAVLNSSEQVTQAVAKSLGVGEVHSESIIQQLIDYVGSKQVLLVLDNCEHLIDASAEVVDGLLRLCPNLQILATSRESLNLTGEVIWLVPPLSLPDPRQISLFDVLLQHECIRLFYERAAAVLPTFKLTLANAAAVVEICARLDGIPLAIELAAARVKVLPAEQIASRLRSVIGSRFDLLNQGSRSALPRQQTLRAAIDWSYDLLDTDERQLFRTLAVFRGGFTLEALERILDFGMRNAESSTRNSQLAIHNSLDLLTQLVDKSLVIVEPYHSQPRYRLLETLREYALEQMIAHAESEALRAHHAQYYLQLATELAPKLIGPRQKDALTKLELEQDNLRAAIEYFRAIQKNNKATSLAAMLLRWRLGFSPR